MAILKPMSLRIFTSVAKQIDVIWAISIDLFLVVKLVLLVFSSNNKIRYYNFRVSHDSIERMQQAISTQDIDKSKFHIANWSSRYHLTLYCEVSESKDKLCR